MTLFTKKCTALPLSQPVSSAGGFSWEPSSSVMVLPGGGGRSHILRTQLHKADPHFHYQLHTSGGFTQAGLPAIN